jgi:hypothetical protein
MENTKQIRIEVSEEIHNKLTEAQDKLKTQGLNMSLANIVVKHLELTKDKIKTGYEK